MIDYEISYEMDDNGYYGALLAFNNSFSERLRAARRSTLAKETP